MRSTAATACGVFPSPRGRRSAVAEEGRRGTRLLSQSLIPSPIWGRGAGVRGAFRVEHRSAAAEEGGPSTDGSDEASFTSRLRRVPNQDLTTEAQRHREECRPTYRKIPSFPPPNSVDKRYGLVSGDQRVRGAVYGGPARGQTQGPGFKRPCRPSSSAAAKLPPLHAEGVARQWPELL
jgi:hypothetical protein